MLFSTRQKYFPQNTEVFTVTNISCDLCLAWEIRGKLDKYNEMFSLSFSSGLAFSKSQWWSGWLEFVTKGTQKRVIQGQIFSP